VENLVSRDEIEAGEAYAFLRVLAPKLAQLKQRLRLANDQLKTGGPDDGRLNALIEAQLALKEFLAGLADLNALVEPIDIVVAALREEAVEREAPQGGVPQVKATQVELAIPAPPAKADPSPEAWLRAGTIAAVQKLINAGMSAANAESYLANTYAAIGLTQRDGSPIAIELIKAWLGPRVGTWRRNSGAKRRMGGLGPPRGPGALVEAQARVDELSAIFKKMAATAPN
jgi:hypothetical protein